MAVAAKFPLTNLELAEIAKGEGIVRFPATADEYWQLLTQAEYRADFYQNEIIAMSCESDFHSLIASQMTFLLKLAYQGRKDLWHFNSNRPVCIPDCENAIFNPDGSIVLLPAKKYEYQPGMNAELTPMLLFEVLSESTRGRDYSEKLLCYKKIPTLQFILFVDTRRPEVTLWQRLEGPDKWLEETFRDPDSQVVLGEHTLSLREIYEGSLV